MPNSDYVCGQRRPRANHNQTFNRARRLPHSQQFSNCCVHHTAPHRTAPHRSVPRVWCKAEPFRWCSTCDDNESFTRKQAKLLSKAKKILKYFWSDRLLSLWFVQVAWNLLSFYLDQMYYIQYIHIYMFYSNKLVMHINVCVCVSSFSYALNLMESSLGEQSFYMFYSCKFVSYEQMQVRYICTCIYFLNLIEYSLV